MGLRSNIVRIYLLEKRSIKYKPAIDRNLNRLFVLHIEYRTSVVTIVSSKYRDEFSAVFNKLGFYSLFVRIVLKRKYV